MIATLMTIAVICPLYLPKDENGRYYFYGENLSAGTTQIYVEGVSGQWVLKTQRDIAVYDHNNKIQQNIVLSQNIMYCLKSDTSGFYACLYTEPVTTDRQEYKKYFIKNGAKELTIGRNADNTITFANKYISSFHSKITISDGQLYITDLDSSNGLYLNNKKIDSSMLEPGDVINIFGLKIIIGNMFVAINNPDGLVSINSNHLLPYICQQPELYLEGDGGDDKVGEVIPYNSEQNTNFYRSPRFKRDVGTESIKVDPPPPNAIGEETPFMMVIGPSMTMGMASMTSGLFAVNNAMASGNIGRAVPSVVMSGSMFLGAVLWPILTKQYDKQRRRRKEAKRQTRYRDYLKSIAAAIFDACENEEEILRENYIGIGECTKRIVNIQRNLWERGYGQNDFLRLRIGVGDALLTAEVKYSERRFAIEEDNLTEEMLSLCESPKYLRNIPITVSLYDDYILGIIGNTRDLYEFAAGLIFQLASLYSYDEVKFVLLVDHENYGDFLFTKWLPHAWSNDRRVRMIATGDKELKEISAFLEKEIEPRLQANSSDAEKISPYYIIFNMSKMLAARADMLKQIYSKNSNIHISVISFYNELRDIPKEATAVIELNGEAGRIFDKNDITGKSTRFAPDITVNNDKLDLSVKLANIFLDTVEGSYKLPTMITFLEMFGAGKIEQLNVLSRWKENDPTRSLEAAIGVNTLGDLFKLDLHEKFHGPHGLVTGMTGSGKSEFIIAYILSMAINYHPYEVAFILIDYKGGGMAKAFESLPHTAGIITNLDGAAVKRSLISIQSELKRRQAIFSEASRNIGVSNIDIYKYQKLYRDGDVDEPLQHLFIISDEFAELKTQQPDFMAQLISAARIGRSLGVHLILATQKPAGVVDDQIWSNSRFRICLKVQERADSMDMLKRPDAASLSETGRFYLQVGYNELFDTGQSAWAGAPYYPSETAETETDNSVTVIDLNGRPIKSAKMDKKRTMAKDPPKQHDVIADYLKDVALREGIKIKQLWLEPMPSMILIDEVKSKYGVSDDESGGYILNPLIGEYDDPAKQRQCALRLPISSEGNTVVYGVAGGGKTTFLSAVVYSLINEHSPMEVNLYILDFASETMRMFSGAPHVGDVVLSYEAEKINNLFKMLLAEVNARKKRFADYGGDYQSFVTSSDEKLPSIVIMINNFSAFTEIYEEREEAVAYLSREGIKYGVYFILAAIGTNSVRLRMLQNFKQLFVLQLNDVSDYSSIVGRTEGLYPSRFKGRGLVRTDALYEFQTAHMTDSANQFAFARGVCAKAREKWPGQKAKKIPLLPKQVDVEFIMEYVNNKNDLVIPIGVDKNSMEVHYYDFKKSYTNIVLATNNDYQAFLAPLAQLLLSGYNHETDIIDAPANMNEQFEGNPHYHVKPPDIENFINNLFDIVVQRNNTVKLAAQNGTETEAFNQKIIVINSYSELVGSIPQECAEKLALILEKGETQYGICVIIGDAVKNLSAYAFEKWYKKHVTQYDGIWVGRGFTEQYQLKANRNYGGLRDDEGAESGMSIKKGRLTRIKLLCDAEADELNG